MVFSCMISSVPHTEINPNVWVFQLSLANKAAVCARVFVKGDCEWCIFWHALVKGECSLSLSQQKKKNDSFAACIWGCVFLGQNCQSAGFLFLFSFLILCSRQNLTKRATAVINETWSRCRGKCKVSFWKFGVLKTQMLIVSRNLEQMTWQGVS